MSRAGHTRWDVAAPNGVDVASLVVDIVAAVGTIAALVVAIVLGRHEIRRFREEQRDRDEEARQRAAQARRAQAEQVSAIAQVQPTPLAAEGRLGPPTGDQRYGAWVDVVNASALPIYGAKALAPTGKKPSEVWVVRIGFVPGNDRGHEHLPPSPDRALDGQPLGVVFRDSGGLWWSRDASGYLSEEPEDPYPPREGSPPAPGHFYPHD